MGVKFGEEKKGSVKDPSPPALILTLASDGRQVVSSWLSPLTLTPPLLQVAREGDSDAMRHLLDSLLNQPQRLQRRLNQLDSERLSPLHYAARYNRLDTLRLLIKYGARANIRGEDGLTPLHFAAR